ncbi:tRNA 2-thiouridine(34) synthase MnmA [Thioalkalivibrio sulfidiphilus]|uniref:tRNA 2-thiouridine(34) synthase MnmA n=1 Tax=Thioalkalivibrio sulfidiphilus TaxID=1033854 RepID=UPI000371DED5|nr:tRNA 2-thiouridine(34) synthase MnmA [Thioalkalivibrio sulfidiphilus]
MSGSRRIIVGMSGGVDSSVAALLLIQAGYRVEGLFMKNWEEDDEPGYCAAAEDLADAKAVCEVLEIPLHKVNFSADYWHRVFSHFLDEYQAGRTPNPDILCNKEIKFRAFLDYARQLGADGIATGHYARIGRDDASYTLLAGRDANKDQTYFLYTLGQEQLSRSLFPIGELEKPRVRELARAHGLPVFAKKDSTGICFIGERRFRDFLQTYLPARPGEIVDPEGIRLGEHQGLMYYTLGQRQGLGIGGVHDADEAPWYVVDKDMAHNRLIVAQGHDHPLMHHRGLEAQDLHWVSGEAPREAFSCRARIRHRQPLQACRVEPLADGRVRVLFDEAQRAIAPGQSVVFYQEDRCLGGGIIVRRFHP